MVLFDYAGVVEEVGQVQTFSSGFQKREIIVGNDVDSNSKYPNPVKFTFVKDKCFLLDDIHQGNRVKIAFAINGRRWDGPKGTQYFVDLTGLKIEVLDAAKGKSPDVPSPAQPTESGTVPYDSVADDMPF